MQTAGFKTRLEISNSILELLYYLPHKTLTENIFEEISNATLFPRNSMMNLNNFFMVSDLCSFTLNFNFF